MRRSFLMFDNGSRVTDGAIDYYKYFNSFTECAEQLFEMSITEIGHHFPTVDAQRALFEKIATKVNPRLKAG